MHGGLFGARVAAFIAQVRAQFGTATFGLIIDQPNLFGIGADGVRHLLAQPLIEGVLVPVVIGRLLVVPRRDLAFLGVAGDLLAGKRANQVGLPFGIEVCVLGELAAALPPWRTRRGVQVGNTQRLLIVLLVFLSGHDLLYTRSDPLVEGLNSR